MSNLFETDQSSTGATYELLSANSNPKKSEALDIAGKQDCILTYHEIVPGDSTYIYRVTSSAFEEHLRFICSMRKSASAERAPRITFDDGHVSNYENSFRLLEQFDLSAVFFVLAGRVGSSSNYISWQQAREMAHAGHRIASHGWSHRMLTQCNSSELNQELVHSKREIEDRLGIEVDAMSAPGGRWDDRVADACASAGYKYLFHSNPWSPFGTRKSMRLQGRHMVTGRMNSRYLRKLMRMSRVERQYLRARYATKERVRLILGDRLYHKLWCWVANWSPGEGMELKVDGQGNSTGESKPS